MDRTTIDGIFGHITDGVAVISPSGKFEYLNRAFLHLTGLSQTATKQNAYEVLSRLAITPEILIKIQNAIEQSEIVSGELTVHRRLRRSLYLQFSVRPLPKNVSPDYLLTLSYKKFESYPIDDIYRYDQLIENINCGVVIYNSDIKVIYANGKAEEILVMPVSDLEGRELSRESYVLYSESGRELNFDDYPVAIALRERRTVTDVILQYHRSSDDKHLWLVANAFPVIGPCGAVSEVILSFSDITRLVESEAETRALRERFELAARATQDIIFEWNVKTGEFSANDVFKGVYGFDPPARMSLVPTGSDDTVVAAPIVRDAVTEAINAGKERYALDYEYNRADGSNGHVAVRAFVVYDDDGSAARIIGTMTDIGQLTRATAALEESERRFRIIADTASDVLWDHDFETGITWSSPDWPSKLGVEFDSEKTQRFQWVEMVDSSDQHRLITLFREAIKSNALSWQTEFKAHSVDGQQFDFALKSSIIRNSSGRALRMLGTIRNITQEKRNQEGYTRARALEAVGQLTGGVAHDFNNLLMIILGNLELLEMSDLSESDGETVEAIAQAAESAAGLTKQLLTFARQAQLNRTRVEVDALLLDTVPLLRAGLPETIGISQSIAPSLWPVDVDANRLQQAIVNLAVNANDAMPRGGEIHISCSNVEVDEDMLPPVADLKSGRYVLISISDTGDGMPPDVLARAFEPFFTTKEVGKGTGLGLSTVYGFAKQSNGGVSIYSEVGHGTTVNLYLPVSEAQAGHSLSAEQMIERGSTQRSKTILVVEDQDQVRAHVEKTLRRLGYEVETAQDAVSALALIRRGDAFDLLFTDIIMPGGMNGQELSEAARQIDSNLKVLYTSGYPAAAFEHLGLKEQSSINFLAKPYKAAQLERILSNIFGNL